MGVNPNSFLLLILSRSNPIFVNDARVIKRCFFDDDGDKDGVDAVDDDILVMALLVEWYS